MTDLLTAIAKAFPQQSDPPTAEPLHKLVVASNTEWTDEGFVLRTTHIKCSCGRDHKNLELFHSYSAPARIAGKATITTRFIPITTAHSALGDRPISEMFRHISIPVCPGCADTKRPASENLFPPIDEAAWRRAVAKKALESAPAAKPQASKTPSTLADVAAILAKASQ